LIFISHRSPICADGHGYQRDGTEPAAALAVQVDFVC
jgi:hypothetical protein